MIPEFEQSVRTILATFAVLVGIPLTDYLRNSRLEGWTHLLIFVVLISLLLRFIIGSAVHLTATYVGRKHPETGAPIPPLSRSRLRFLKDLSFLIAFGYLSTFLPGPLIAPTPDIDAFVWRAMAFVGAAIAWCWLDMALAPPSRPDRPGAPIEWLWINVLQLIFTFLVLVLYEKLAVPGAETALAAVLAVAYAAAFAADVWYVIERFQVPYRRPEDAA